MPSTWSAIVLAGGRSSRLGSDKVQARIDNRTLVDHVLAAIPAPVDVIVVGPDPHATARSYRLTRELQAGSGPVAAIDAGLTQVTTALVAVVAVDMPFAAALLPTLVDELRAASRDIDAVIPVDVDAREQPLAAVYRTEALRRAAASLGGVENRSVRALRGALRVTLRPVDSPSRLLDVDTPHDLAAARRSVPSTRDMTHTEEGESMDEWVAAVSAALGIEQAVDLDTILDVARDAAHAVERPAAPVTTFLLGCAVAAGASPVEAAAKISALAQEWPKPQ